MAMMQPTFSLKDFTESMAEAADFPFYGVLLYPPLNGLNERLHKYVVSRWHYLNQLTGTSCLLVTVEDIDRDGQDFRPEEIYDIARHLGVSVADIPCLVFFVKPESYRDAIVLKLRQFLPAPKEISDDDLTDLFASIASVMDSCAEEPDESRLQCLQRGLDRRWPRDSRWYEVASQSSGWLIATVTTSATVLKSIETILPIVRRLLGG